MKKNFFFQIYFCIVLLLKCVQKWPTPFYTAMCGKRAGQVRKNGTTSIRGDMFLQKIVIGHERDSLFRTGSAPLVSSLVQHEKSRSNSGGILVVNYVPQEACRSLSCIMINLANTILRFCATWFILSLPPICESNYFFFNPWGEH